MYTKAIATFFIVVYHSSIFLLSVAFTNITTPVYMSTISAIRAKSHNTRFIALLIPVSNEVAVLPVAVSSNTSVVAVSGALGTPGKNSVFWFLKSVVVGGGVAKLNNHNELTTQNPKKSRSFLVIDFI